jgi:hypothetical protein
MIERWLLANYTVIMDEVRLVERLDLKHDDQAKGKSHDDIIL